MGKVDLHCSYLSDILIFSITHPTTSILKISISQHALRGGRSINLSSLQVLQQVEMSSRIRPNKLEICVTDISACAHNSPGFLDLLDVLVSRLASRHNISSSYGTTERPRELYEDFCRDWRCPTRFQRVCRTCLNLQSKFSMLKKLFWVFKVVSKSRSLKLEFLGEATLLYICF